MRIQSINFDSSALSVEDQFASWASHSGNTALSPLRPGPFRARGTFWNLGSVYIVDAHLDPFASYRDEPLVRTDPADYIQLVALYGGSVRFEADEIDQSCFARDMFVRDYARASRATATRIHTVTVYFARGYLEASAGPVRVHGLVPLIPEMVVLGTTLRAIVDQLPKASATSAGLFARTLRDLLAAIIIRWSNNATKPARLDARRLAKAKAFIAAQLPGTLSVDQLTSELSVSRSVLFEMFRTHGGIMTYDRLRRLRSLYRELSNLADRRPVSELGAMHGFLDKAELTRSFRRAFGCSPSEVRGRLLSDERNHGPLDTAKIVRAAVDRLS